MLIFIVLLLILTVTFLLYASSIKNKNYNISFGDSGVGGLIFAIDNYKKINSYLQNIESKYHIRFNLYHIGDSANAPYGILSPLEIKKLTNNFINYMVNELDSRIAIVACNTASISFDKKYKKYIKNNFSDLKIIPIIKESVKKLYSEASVMINSLGKREVHLGILATKATIESGIYEKYLRKLHNEHNPDVELFSYYYSPNNWVENIENAINDNKSKEDVSRDLNEMLVKFSKIKNISALGLFCTHFSFLLDDIKSFFEDKLENNNLKIITQGELFANNIKNQIKKDIVKINIKKRNKPLKKQRLITIKSRITGKNTKQTQEVIKNMFPKIYDLINIKKIPKIKETITIFIK